MKEEKSSQDEALRHSNARLAYVFETGSRNHVISKAELKLKYTEGEVG